MTKTEFLNTFHEIAKEVVTKSGYSEKIVPAVVAQAAHESNYGQSTLSDKYYNFFGMKCGSWQGKSVSMTTWEEYEKGTITNISANFRAYDSVRDGIEGYVEFLKYSRYAILFDIDCPYNYIQSIKDCGWATDSIYVTKVTAVMESIYTDAIQNGIFYDDVSRETLDYKIAEDVINGKYGNGDERKYQLGSIYEPIQVLVNAILRG